LNCWRHFDSVRLLNSTNRLRWAKYCVYALAGQFAERTRGQSSRGLVNSSTENFF